MNKAGWRGLLCLVLGNNSIGWGGPVTYKAQYHPQYEHYLSGPVNELLSDLTWDQMATGVWDKAERDKKATFLYRCPGDSFLTGMRTLTDDGDRQFFFICSFLSNPQGKGLEIEKCYDTQMWEGTHTSISAPFAEYDNTIRNPGSSKCAPTQALHGLISKYQEEERDKSMYKDRQLKSICCGIRDKANQLSLKIDSAGCSDHLQPLSEKFEFRCADHKVISNISTNYISDTRQYQFTCCPVGT